MAFIYTEKERREKEEQERGKEHTRVRRENHKPFDRERELWELTHPLSAYYEEKYSNPLWAKVIPHANKKMKVSESTDPCEIEADSIAEKVVNMNDTDIQQKNIIGNDTIQAKSESHGTEVSPEVESELNNLTGGKPLSESEQNYYGSRFGEDFSDVKIHDDASAHELADKLDARAFAMGNDIVFGEGERTHDISGNKLMAHELTHVVQQNNNKVSRQQNINNLENVSISVLQRRWRDDAIDHALRFFYWWHRNMVRYFTYCSDDPATSILIDAINPFIGNIISSNWTIISGVSNQIFNSLIERLSINSIKAIQSFFGVSATPTQIRREAFERLDTLLRYELAHSISTIRHINNIYNRINNRNELINMINGFPQVSFYETNNELSDYLIRQWVLENVGGGNALNTRSRGDLNNSTWNSAALQAGNQNSHFRINYTGLFGSRFFGVLRNTPYAFSYQTRRHLRYIGLDSGNRGNQIVQNAENDSNTMNASEIYFRYNNININNFSSIHDEIRFATFLSNNADFNSNDGGYSLHAQLLQALRENRCSINITLSLEIPSQGSVFMRGWGYRIDLNHTGITPIIREPIEFFYPIEIY